jgi:hypothetical protein
VATDASNGEGNRAPARTVSATDDGHSMFAGPAAMVTAAVVARRYHFDNPLKVQVMRSVPRDDRLLA